MLNVILENGILERTMCRISKTTLIAIGVSSIIILVWGGSWWWISQHFQNHDERGTFGDMFGAVNALFSGFAFAGLIMTLFYQKEELKLQREELKQTRAELEGQKREFEIQNKTLKQQQFSTTFFQLLNAVQKNIDNLEMVLEDDHRFKKNYKGVNCFGGALRMIRKSIQDYRISIEKLVITQEEVSDIYKKIYKESLYPMGLFFRSYYHLIKYIVISDLDDKEKYQYISFARSQLSDDVISVLFFYSIGYGNEKFKKMAEDWVLLNNIPEKIFIFDEMRNWISEGAYKRNGRYGEDEEKRKMRIE